MDWFVDPERGRWLQERIPELGEMVPTGMPAYGRILHPAYESNDDGEERSVRWAELATRTGTTVDGDTQWWDISPDGGSGQTKSDGWWLNPPQDGWIDPALLRAFVPVLWSHTRTPEDITVGVWEGWGLTAVSTSLFFVGDAESDAGADVEVELDRLRSEAEDHQRRRLEATSPRLLRMQEFDGTVWERAVAGDVSEFPYPRFDLPDRTYVLGATTLDDLASPDWPYRSGLGWLPGDRDGIMPQLIWPADRSWCLSIEVDAPWTVVAGAPELVAELLSLPGIEGHAIGDPYRSRA
ncbi:hypothetical protein [Leifsonia sp. NPDC080035]|uniref:DUF317 domain-containing protein n=1 Tax=Leifsonia sp. NPDC080035 TaxID=3143936 RepID=A0AAU7G9Y0_9MICO